MALPSVTLTGQFLNADGSASAGTVSFAPSAQIVDAHDVVVLPQTPVTRSLDSSGSFSVKLLPTDAAGLTPVGWTYTVTVHVGGGTPVTFSILLPSSPNPVDLSAIAPAVPQPAVIQYVPVGGGTMTGVLILGGTPPLRIAAGASSGYVLTSDGSGNASWTAAPAGVPSGTVVSETGYGQAATAGAATAYSRGDHTHGSPSLGTTSTTACAGNDSRLSDARTPVAHATTHATGGSDPVSPSSIGAASSSRVLSAGTGLTGGGDLTADRSFAVAYGTTGTTAAAGNDARITGAVQASTVTTKGDLLAATGNAAIARLAAGSNSQILTADSTQTSGLKWAAAPPDALYPPSGYGMVALSIDPMTVQASSGLGNQIWVTRIWIPAGKTITSLWAAVRTGGTWDTVSTPNQLVLYDDTAAKVDNTADDGTLWTAAGWRGGALVGGTQAAQSAGRFAYILISVRGMSGLIVPFPGNASDSNAPYAAVGVGGATNRRTMYANGGTPPASFNPVSYGTASGFIPVVGAS